MNSIEYVEDIRPDGLLQIPPVLLKQLGLTKKVRITQLFRGIKLRSRNRRSYLKSAALFKHSPNLGVPDDPELLRYSC